MIWVTLALVALNFYFMDEFFEREDYIGVVLALATIACFIARAVNV